jgi:hypothetical protein
MKNKYLLATWYLMRAELQYRLCTEISCYHSLDLIERINEVRQKRRRMEQLTLLQHGGIEDPTGT